MTSGIYQIKNLLNDKVYIGSAVNIQERWHVHKSTLRNNKHRNPLLQRSWNKYGESAFEFSIIEIVNDKKDLITEEQKWFNSILPHKREKGFNINPVAGSNLGRKWSKEQHKKMSNIMTGKRHSEFTKQKISNMQKGRKLTQEHKENISKGISGNKNPFYGRSHSMKSRILMSEKRSGEKSWNAKLTFEEVCEIRRKYIPKKYSQYKLAKEYKVSRGTIQNILNNRTWRE